MKKNGLILLTLFNVLVVSCKKQNSNNLDDIDCSTINSKYTADIKLIIDANCLGSGCHNAGSSKGDFTTYSGLKAIADDGSLEKKVITNQSMPPSSPLSLDDRKKIKCWINSGSPKN